MTLDDIIKGLAYCQETNGVPSPKCLGCPLWNCYNCTYVLRAWAINALNSMKKPKEENIMKFDKEELPINRLISAWCIFSENNPYQICEGKEFQAMKDPDYCMGQMLNDTIAELKYRRPMPPIWDNERACCWQCGKKLPKKKGIKYCAYCGQAVEIDALD